jgi:hypothetical protein
MRFKTEVVELDGEKYTMYPPKGRDLADLYKVVNYIMSKQDSMPKDEKDIPKELPFNPDHMEGLHKVIMSCLKKKHIHNKEDEEEIDYIVSQNIMKFIAPLFKVSGLGDAEHKTTE